MRYILAFIWGVIVGRWSRQSSPDVKTYQSIPRALSVAPRERLPGIGLRLALLLMCAVVIGGVSLILFPSRGAVAPPSGIAIVVTIKHGAVKLDVDIQQTRSSTTVTVSAEPSEELPKYPAQGSGLTFAFEFEPEAKLVRCEPVATCLLQGPGYVYVAPPMGRALDGRELYTASIEIEGALAWTTDKRDLQVLLPRYAFDKGIFTGASGLSAATTLHPKNALSYTFDPTISPDIVNGALQWNRGEIYGVQRVDSIGAQLLRGTNFAQARTDSNTSYAAGLLAGIAGGLIASVVEGIVMRRRSLN